jgi:hypothetical protein
VGSQENLECRNRIHLLQNQICQLIIFLEVLLVLESLGHHLEITTKALRTVNLQQTNMKMDKEALEGTQTELMGQLLI